MKHKFGEFAKFVLHVAISSRNPRMTAFTASGASRWHQCAAPSITAVRALGITLAIASANAGGVTLSSSPHTQRVGHATDRGSTISASAVAADHSAYASGTLEAINSRNSPQSAGF